MLISKLKTLSKTCVVTFIAIIFSGQIYQVLSCTAFVIKGRNDIVIGKNLDWELGEGYLVVNPSGKSKTTLTNHGQPVSWISKYGSVTFNQFGLGFPLGGMNEHGLVVEELSSPKWGRTESDKPILNEFQWTQYQLDMFRSVDEVINGLSKYSMQSHFLYLHYLVADKNGNTAVIEINNGVVHAYRGASLPYPVLSNNPYPESVIYLKNFQGFGGDMPVIHRPGSNERFVSACHLIKEKNDSKKPKERAVEILETVKQNDTQWSILYNPVKMIINFRLLNSDTEYEINIDSGLFKKQKSFAFIDLHQIPTPKIKTGDFKDFTYDFHQRLVSKVIQEMEAKQMLNEQSKSSLYEILNYKSS